MSNEREDLEGRIAAYIDGELSPADAARLEVYLANSDPKLADQIIGMLADKHRLTSLDKPRAPDDLAARIMEQVERASLLNNVDQLTSHHRPWWQSRAAVAAALFLFVGGLTYFIMQGLHPANPAWQAALQPTPRPPAIPAAPSPSIAAITPPISAPSAGVAAIAGEAGGGGGVGGGRGGAAGPLIASAASVAPRDDAASPAAKNRMASEQLGSLDKTDLADKKTAAKVDELAMKTTKDSLAGGTNKPPLVLAFVADGPGDFARLHAALDTLLAGDASNGNIESTLATRQVQKPADRAAALDQTAATPQNYNAITPAENNNSMAAQQKQTEEAGRMPALRQAGIDAAKSQADTRPGGDALASSQNPSQASYHVTLRRADIEQLTRQFHVQSSNALKEFAFGVDAPTTMPAQNNAAAPSDAPIDCIVTMTAASTTQESPH